MTTAGASRVAAVGLPLDASADGVRIDGLFAIAAWLTGGLALIMVIWLGVMLVRDRAGRGGARRSEAPDGGGRRGPLVAVAITTAVFLAVDGTLFWISTRDLRAVFLRTDEADREPGAVRVEVDAHQWSWAFRQAGPDARFGTADDVVALDRLVVPRGRAVVLEVASRDVVHGLYLPAFRVKIDAVPGRVLRTWFRPAKTGRFEVGCSQFCGVAHYQMLGVVDVLEPAAHDAWIAAEATRALAIEREDERARADEPDRLPDPRWPRFSPIDPSRSRDGAWPWGGGPR